MIVLLVTMDAVSCDLCRLDEGSDIWYPQTAQLYSLREHLHYVMKNPHQSSFHCNLRIRIMPCSHEQLSGTINVV